MIAVLCHVVSPTGQRSVGWRPSSIARNPVACREPSGDMATFTPVKFNQRTWG